MIPENDMRSSGPGNRFYSVSINAPSLEWRIERTEVMQFQTTGQDKTRALQ